MKLGKIDNIQINNKALQEVGSLLKGPSETAILLTIERQNKKVEINIIREDIQIPAVSFVKKINKNTGIIKLNTFTNTASSEFKKGLKSLIEQNIENLIIDLRSNGGGLLNEAVKIVSLFVSKGELVVSTKSRIPQMNRSYNTLEQPIAPNLPVVVLIDEMSASASEIVAGSLQDLDRAVIIGNTSYGKGLVQQTKQVSFGGQIKLTVAKYYTPSGRCIQKIDYSTKSGASKKIEDSLVRKYVTRNGREVVDSRGIEPDIKVEAQYFNAITEAILNEDLIFEFTNGIISSFENDSLSPLNFSIEEATYNKFIDFALSKEIDYQTASNFHLEELKDVASKEKYIKENEALFLQMDSVFKTDVRKDLKKHKSEIIFFLENEIISRKHYQSGRVEASLKKDPFIIASEKIFEADSIYSHLLGF